MPPALASAPPPPTPLDGAQLWEDIVAKAAASPRDAALFANFAFRALSGNSLTLGLKPGNAGSDYLRGNVEVIRSTVSRLAQRPLEVRLDVEETPVQRPRPASRGVPEALRNHPSVKLVADLFDAAPIEANSLRRDEASDDAIAPATITAPREERAAEDSDV